MLAISPEGACQATAKPTGSPEAANSKNAAPAKPVRVISDLSQFHLDRAPGPIAQTANQISAGTRGGQDSLVLCAPLLGLTQSAHPTFEWKGASRVTFTLLNEAGDVLYEEQVAGSSLKYPDTAAALEPGQSYSWKVSGGGMDGLPAPARFAVQTPVSQQKTGRESEAQGVHADPLVLAQVFLADGLWYDTIATLQAAILEYPGRKDLREQLHVLYQGVAPACVDRAAR